MVCFAVIIGISFDNSISLFLFVFVWNASLLQNIKVRMRIVVSVPVKFVWRWCVFSRIFCCFKLEGRELTGCNGSSFSLCVPALRL